jgi:ElaB/YqjD/DUF883 family membrane-anchored ribosome-binding protein
VELVKSVLDPCYPWLKLPQISQIVDGFMLRCILSQQVTCRKRQPLHYSSRHNDCSRVRLAQILFFHFEKEYSDMPENGSINEPTTGTTGATTGATGKAGTGAATALSQTAQDYGQKISEVASQAKDYVSDKVSVVGDKFKELQNADLGELAENAKEYARQKPGQALLISAAAGLLLGLIIRGRR